MNERVHRMLAERIGDEVIHYSRLLNCLGWLHLELGDLVSSCRAEQPKRGDCGTWAARPCLSKRRDPDLGNIYLAKGEIARAGDLLDEAYRFWESPSTNPWMQGRYSMRLFDSLGRLCLARGELGRAGEFADRSLERAMATNSRKSVVKAWRPRGEVALANGELDAAESRARTSAFGGPCPCPPQSDPAVEDTAGMGELCAVRHRPEEATDAYLAARAVLERVKAGRQDPGLRATLEQAPGVPRVDERAAWP